MSRRRMWIVLALLAIIVVAGGVRWYLARDADGDASDERPNRPATTQTTPAEELPPVPLEPEGEADDEEGEQPAPSLVVTTRDARGAAGGNAIVVTELGPVPLEPQLPTIDDVTRAVGPPTTEGGDAQLKDVCVGRWDDVGLTGYFLFGHPPSLRASCAEGVLVTAVLGGGWSTDRGLVVGDTFARLQELYPQAEQEDVSASFARIIGSDQLYALARGDYGGSPFTTLAAAVIDDDVSAIIFLSGAD